MLGAADHRNVGPWSGGRDELADCLAALHGRSEVERAPVDVSANRRRRLVSRLGTAADERKIAAGGQEPSSRAGDAPGAGDRGHFEVVTENEAGEAETPPEKPAEASGGGGGGAAGSRTRYRTWATITAGQPAPRAARNGTRSQRSSSSMVASTSGKARCESTEVRPCPGKCLATGTSPSESRASTNATPHAAMISGAVPNARSSITVFAGLSRQSSTGASPESNPAARSSRAIALATATAR